VHKIITEQPPANRAPTSGEYSAYGGTLLTTQRLRGHPTRDATLSFIMHAT